MGLPSGRSVASGRTRSSAVARLPALASGLRRQIRVLREAALLIRHTLAALAARYRGQFTILREAALGARHALPALTPRLGRQAPVLREAALLVRNGLAAHARNLTLPLGIHRCEAAM